MVPDRLVVGLERPRARRDRHREAAHDAQEPRRRRHAGRRLPDDPGLRRRGRDGHERVPAVRALRRPGDGRRDREQHRDLEPGELARGNFLHWAWQIKFEAAKNTAHVVDKMLHACGGSGYKRDMELERYLRDAKAGWVMGPTNEVLRQFVGKAVLLGFESLDYWNQSYNRRAVENEVKKLDAAGKRELAEQLVEEAEAQEAKEPAKALSRGDLGRTPAPPRPGARAVGPVRERYRVRRGAATASLLAAGRPAHRPRPRRRPARRGHRCSHRTGSRTRGARRRATAPPRSSARSSDRTTDGAADVIVERLAARGPDPTNATAALLFGPSIAARARRRRSAPSGRSSSWSGRPTGAPVVEGGVPASDLELEIAPARLGRTTSSSRAPEPLAEPRLDFQVDRASALAYEVKAGEYIQIIDVEGRQCSDFLAFHAREAAGRRRARARPDATRSLMGSAYPQPGLYSKFFDLDLEALVEVDPRHGGRHDTFGARLHVASTTRTWATSGTSNCSDNFNAAARAVRDRAAQGLAGDQLLLQHDVRRRQRPRLRRAVVPARATTSCCGRDRPRVPLERVPRRHRRGERVGSDRGPRPRLPGRARFSAAIAHRVTPDAEPS